jgi:peptidoglycan/LPS O-acetylase OafA/YrhL
MTGIGYQSHRSSPPVGGHQPFLDLLRCLAALLVLLGHTRGLLFSSFQDVGHPGLGTKIFYFVTGIHREGVAIFFAVSGFLVGGAAWRAIAERRFQARAYLASRFARIYVVLLPALALTFLLDWAGRAVLSDTRFYGVRPLLPIGLSSNWTWEQLACNLAAVQGIFCRPLGANPPLWSLGYEWVFYLLAPVLFGLCLGRRPALVKVCGAALLFLGVAYLAGGFAKWAPWLAIWLAGALAAQLARRDELPPITGLAGIGLVAAGFFVSRLQAVPPVGTDLVVGLGTALAIANPRLLAWCPLPGPIRTGADFSFSLYLIHVPVTVLLGALLERFGWPPSLVAPGLPAYLAFSFLVTGALVAAFAFAQATERHTGKVRRLLLGQGREPAPAHPTPA